MDPDSPFCHTAGAMQRNDLPYKMTHGSFHYVEGWPGSLFYAEKMAGGGGGGISLPRIMTQVISLRNEMTHGSFCRGGGVSFLCITPTKS